jgi:hypothetical protein
MIGPIQAYRRDKALEHLHEETSHERQVGRFLSMWKSVTRSPFNVGPLDSVRR